MLNVNFMGVDELRLAVQELRRYPAECHEQAEEIKTLRKRVADLESANADVRTRIRQLEDLTIDAMAHVRVGPHNPLWELIKAYREVYGVDLKAKPETEGE